MKQYIIKFIQKLIKIFYIFPVDKKLITVVSFHGDSYTCSPKYITEYISKHYPEFKIVWAFNEPDKFVNYLPKGVSCVKYKSIKYIYYAIKSFVRINNAEEWIILERRYNQLVINTWHAGCSYKKVGHAASLINSELGKFDYYNISNLFLSGSKEISKLVFRNSFLYKGKILESGTPRNDILVNINKDVTQYYKKKYNVTNKKVILYAPTFRETSINIAPINLDMIKQALKNRFGGDWLIWTRAHLAALSGKGSTPSFDKCCLDMSYVFDMQELLCACDVLITDYSSSMWDFSFTKRPIFLYVPDIEDYANDERGFYYSIEKWGFPYAKTNDELAKLISNFVYEDYVDLIDTHHKNMGSFESGHATKDVVKFIVDYSKADNDELCE